MEPNEITGLAIDIGMSIHQKLGPGLLESVYPKIMVHELKKQNLKVESEVPISVYWDGNDMDLGFRADLIIEEKVIVELKSVEKTMSVHHKQVLTYLKVTGLSVGLLLNFGETRFKDGIHRLVNNYKD